MTVLNPVEIESKILGITNRISKGISVFTERYDKFMAADRDYDLSFARAYLEAEGSIEDKKKRAIVSTHDLRTARDVAEVEFKQADKLLRALELELRALQSIGASVRQQYSVAGRGE